jgi:hypothetical protein
MEFLRQIVDGSQSATSARCMKEGIVGGDAVAVDASIIAADARRRRGVTKVEDLDPTSSRAVAEYLSVPDHAAFGGATSVEPKTISPTDPAARYTASANFIDLKHAVITDVEAMTAIREAEVGAAKTVLDRAAEQFDVTPSRLVADGGYGSAEIAGWLVDERGIEPHVNLDKSELTDGALSRSDFAFDDATAAANALREDANRAIARRFYSPRRHGHRAAILLSASQAIAPSAGRMIPSARWRAS